jgi:hypothetical protein
LPLLPAEHWPMLQECPEGRTATSEQPGENMIKRLGKAALGAALSLGLVAGGAASTAAQEVDAAGLLGAVEPQVTIELNGEEAVQGEAVLRSVGEQTEVSIEVAGAPTDAELAGFLISGTCAEEGEVIAVLGALDVDAEGNGQLNAALPVDLETITSAPVSVEVRPDAEVPMTLACGEHTPAREDAPYPTPEPEPLPDPAPLPDPLPEPLEEDAEGVEDVADIEDATEHEHEAEEAAEPQR